MKYEKTISLWDIKPRNIPTNYIENFSCSFYYHENILFDSSPNNGINKLYTNLSDIFRINANEFFMDQKSRLCLISNYPNSAKYVNVKLSFDLIFFISLFGLVRRLLNKTVKFNKLLILKNKNKNRLWIQLQNNSNQTTNKVHFTLSEDIGIKKFLLFLNKSNVDYLITRFYEKLPNLYRPGGGDLDILVSDEGYKTITDFLNKNPGNIPVDIQRCSKPTGGANIPYFPPKLAKRMLLKKKKINNLFYAPNKLDYLLSFIYHCLYHKGMSSGISSTFKDLKKIDSENNYELKIKELLHENNINTDINMENLAKILKKYKWEPAIDTLDHIKNTNLWVWRNYFSERKSEEFGLSILIIKNGFFRKYLLDEILIYISKQNFKILSMKKLDKKLIDKTVMNLRGGNWTTNISNNERFIPSYVMVLLDEKLSYTAKPNTGLRIGRIRQLKDKLRKKYPTNEIESFFHATDDTDQSWEYLELLFNKEKIKLEHKIREIISKRKRSIFQYLTIQIIIKYKLMLQRIKYKINKIILNY